MPLASDERPTEHFAITPIGFSPPVIDVDRQTAVECRVGHQRDRVWTRRTNGHHRACLRWRWPSTKTHRMHCSRHTSHCWNGATSSVCSLYSLSIELFFGIDILVLVDIIAIIYHPSIACTLQIFSDHQFYHRRHWGRWLA